MAFIIGRGWVAFFNSCPSPCSRLELNNPQWSEGIYQLETTDPVLGGPNGIANRQAKELAARTQYLKKKQEEYKPGAASTTKAGIVQLSSATDSNSEELAATPKAVKAAYDKAVESAGKGLPVGAVIGFTSECYNVQITAKSSGRSGSVGTDLTIGVGEITATGFSAMLNTWAQGAAANDFQGFAWRAIGK